MLIDINTYAGHWPFKQLQYTTCASRLERMNKFGIDISVISSLNGIFYKNTQAANEELFYELNSDKSFNGRFIQFAVINPIYAGWKDDLETCSRKMGMKGVRVYPQYHDYAVNDPSFVELVKTARDLDLPVAIDIRMVDSRQRSWMDIPVFEAKEEKYDIITKEWNLVNIIPVIKEVPDAKYVIVNLANGMNLSREDIELIKRTNVLFDTSGRSLREENRLSELLNRFGKDKFAFGSHSPVLDQLTGLLRIESMNPSEADDSVKEVLRSGNAKRMLNI